MGEILLALADENLVIDPIFYKSNAEYQKHFPPFINSWKNLTRSITRKKKV